jgi:hypothetical protein
MEMLNENGIFLILAKKSTKVEKPGSGFWYFGCGLITCKMCFRTTKDLVFDTLP